MSSSLPPLFSFYMTLMVFKWCSNQFWTMPTMTQRNMACISLTTSAGLHTTLESGQVRWNRHSFTTQMSIHDRPVHAYDGDVMDGSMKQKNSWSCVPMFYFWLATQLCAQYCLEYCCTVHKAMVMMTSYALGLLQLIIHMYDKIGISWTVVMIELSLNVHNAYTMREFWCLYI